MIKNIFIIFSFMFAFLCTNYAFCESVPVAVVDQPVVEAMQPKEIKQEEQKKTVEDVKLTVKDEAFVPPEWLQNALLEAKSIPVVGPYIVTLMKWLGVIVSVLTALFAFLWSILRAGQMVFSAAKMVELAEKLAALENSKLMYYLKAFSMFNAQKKDKPV